MAGHLIRAGYDLTVYNRTVAKTAPLAAMGAKVASTPAEVAAASDVVISIVGMPHDVRECILGEHGVLKSLRSGGILVDMTTSEPALAIEIATAAAAAGVHTLDAPVSGGDIGARNAALTIMCGGDEATFRAVQPLFELMGKNINLTGPAGSGQHTKVCNQILIAASMMGLVEALLYAEKAGLDADATIRAVSGGAANSFSLTVLGPRIVKGDFEPGFFIDHFVKDLGIALDMAKAMGLALPGLAMAHQFYVAAQAQGFGKKGTQALYRVLRSMNGM